MNGHHLCKVKSECLGKVKVWRELGGKIVNKIINMGQNNSSQLFVHLLKDTLKTRGAQQQVTNFLVRTFFKTPSPSPALEPAPYLACSGARRRGCGLPICSRVTVVKACGPRAMAAAWAPVLQLSLPAALAAGLSGIAEASWSYAATAPVSGMA